MLAQKPIAITMGEPSGIGGEITLKSWLRRSAFSVPFVAIDNPDRLRSIAHDLGFSVPIETVSDLKYAAVLFPDALPVCSIDLPSKPQPGVLNQSNANAAIASIDKAANLAKANLVSAIVTNPIHKHNLYCAGFTYPGHTEYLAHLSGANIEPVMMLACDGLRTVPITTHLSLREAISELSIERIVSQSRITARALEQDFGLSAPRLAIAGLNPHAGEDGAIGDEETKFITPAINILREDGLQITGPLPPDAMFSATTRPTFDAAICMYHDQALIPIKTLDFSGGVNVTLGLPFVRTSPDHGTALDIAGKGVADETSMVAAVRMATEIARFRGVEAQ